MWVNAKGIVLVAVVAALCQAREASPRRVSEGIERRIGSSSSSSSSSESTAPEITLDSASMFGVSNLAKLISSALKDKEAANDKDNGSSGEVRPRNDLLLLSSSFPPLLRPPPPLDLLLHLDDREGLHTHPSRLTLGRGGQARDGEGRGDDGPRQEPAGAPDGSRKQPKEGRGRRRRRGRGRQEQDDGREIRSGNSWPVRRIGHRVQADGVPA
ncbi:uncharacterized protein LOC125031314 [Penaeus chinensis]|uniref:uncharacterized protein LOC125031314 n=1 Tax=Penaeus chinensis TaxID=139456 RepID=UPI001FB7490B|nr:uncharacterized protein LOC125031314 [Penaeus chinensis]